MKIYKNKSLFSNGGRGGGGPGSAFGNETVLYLLSWMYYSCFFYHRLPSLNFTQEKNYVSFLILKIYNFLFHFKWHPHQSYTGTNTGHSLMRTLQPWVVETWRQLTWIIINEETGNYQKLNLAQFTANYCSRTESFNQNHSHVHLCLKCVKKLKRFTFH